MSQTAEPHKAGAQEQERAFEVFCSYSHRDERLRKQFETHISLLKREGHIAVWHDRKIGAGREWADQIDDHLNTADIILLLISPDFIASDYCYDLEMTRAMQRHAAGEARVIPILLRKVDWQKAPFGKLQALPRDDRPITSRANRDEAFYEVAQGIREVVDELRKTGLKRPSSSSPVSPAPPVSPTSPVSVSPVSPTPRSSVTSVPPSTDAHTIEQRETVVKDIYTRLTQPDINALVLTGIGGLGKSTLAALVHAYAEKQRQAGTSRFEEIIWLSFDPTTTMLDLAESLFAAIGQPLADFAHLTPQNQAAALLNALSVGDKARFIALDQFENLLDWQSGQALENHPGVGEWLDLINAYPCRCRLLLTSRPEPRGSREDAPNYVQPYPVPDLQALEGASLLRKRGVNAAQATDAELREAVTRCQGHALALTLLASILRRNRSLTLNMLFSNTLYAHQWPEDIARSLLDYIYAHQLSETARGLLRAFSIYREPVPLDAAHALLPTTSPTQLTSALNALLNQHLIEPAGTGTGLYQPHTLVAAHARTHFTEGNEQANQQALQEVHLKAAAYYQQQASTICPPQEKCRKVVDVQPLIEAFWHLCQGKQWQEAYDLANQEKLFSGLNLWGGNTILLELYQLLLPSVDWRPEPSVASHIYHYLAWAYSNLGRKREALQYNEQALSIVREVGDRRGEGTTLNNLGMLYDDLGRKEEALQHYEQALVIHREVGNRAVEGTTLNNLGGLYNDLRRKEEALHYYEQALVIRREVGDRGGEGATLNNLGSLYVDLGQKEEALGYYEQALVIRREVGDRGGEGITSHNIGTIYFEQGNYATALACFLLARTIFDEVKSPNRAVPQSYIDAIQKGLGEERFTTLLAQVEPQAGQIVERALETIGGGEA